jgi:DNA-binding PadR family transcriptional regulator
VSESRCLVAFLIFARDMQARRYRPRVAELAVIYRVTPKTIYRCLHALEEVGWQTPYQRREKAA